MAKTSVGHKLLTGQLSYDFVGRRKAYYLASVAIVIVALGALLLRGLELGIEFRGGTEFTAPAQVTDTTVDDVRNAVEKSGVSGVDGSTVTTIGDNTVRVQTRALEATAELPQVRAAIAEAVGTSPEEVAHSLIGPTWGGQIAKSALIALIVFLALVALLIAFYFRNWRMSVAAILALLHDVVVTVGIYALVGFTVTPASVIGLLTILGYSLYDTVVVFDKVRENTAEMTTAHPDYPKQANLAINQVFVRSINTTLTGVLPVAALLFLGLPGPLKDLGLVLLIGMIAGAYSSLFLATPLLVDLRSRRLEHRPVDEPTEAAAEPVKKPEPVAVSLADEETDISLTGDTGAVATDDSDEPSPDRRSPREQPRRQPRSKRN